MEFLTTCAVADDMVVARSFAQVASKHYAEGSSKAALSTYADALRCLHAVMPEKVRKAFATDVANALRGYSCHADVRAFLESPATIDAKLLVVAPCVLCHLQQAGFKVEFIDFIVTACREAARSAMRLRYNVGHTVDADVRSAVCVCATMLQGIDMYADLAQAGEKFPSHERRVDSDGTDVDVYFDVCDECVAPSLDSVADGSGGIGSCIASTCDVNLSAGRRSMWAQEFELLPRPPPPDVITDDMLDLTCWGGSASNAGGSADISHATACDADESFVQALSSEHVSGKIVDCRVQGKGLYQNGDFEGAFHVYARFLFELYDMLPPAVERAFYCAFADAIQVPGLHRDLQRFFSGRFCGSSGLTLCAGPCAIYLRRLQLPSSLLQSLAILCSNAAQAALKFQPQPGDADNLANRCSALVLAICAVMLNPCDVKAWYRRAQSFIVNGRFSRARWDLEYLLCVHGQNRAAKAALRDVLPHFFAFPVNPGVHLCAQGFCMPCFSYHLESVTDIWHCLHCRSAVCLKCAAWVEVRPCQCPPNCACPYHYTAHPVAVTCNRCVPGPWLCALHGTQVHVYGVMFWVSSSLS